MFNQSNNIATDNDCMKTSYGSRFDIISKRKEITQFFVAI